MLKKEIKDRLKKDSLLVTKFATALEKPYPTVRSWVYRDSSKLLEYPVLSALAKLLGVSIEELMEDEELFES